MPRARARHILVATQDACQKLKDEIAGGANVPLVFELRGSKGSLNIEGHHPGGYQCGELVTRSTSEATQPPFLQGLSGQAINVAQLWAHFESDIRSGKRTVPDFDAGVRLHALLDAIDKASDEGRTIRIG